MAFESKVKVGDVLADNDPRYPGRTVEVIEVVEGRPWIVAKSAKVAQLSIALYRIHTDGKKRRSGFSLVPRS